MRSFSPRMGRGTSFPTRTALRFCDEAPRTRWGLPLVGAGGLEVGNHDRAGDYGSFDQLDGDAVGIARIQASNPQPVTLLLDLDGLRSDRDARLREPQVHRIDVGHPESDMGAARPGGIGRQRLTVRREVLEELQDLTSSEIDLRPQQSHPGLAEDGAELGLAALSPPGCGATVTAPAGFPLARPAAGIRPSRTNLTPPTG